jgi:hypothetical protein
MAAMNLLDEELLEKTICKNLAFTDTLGRQKGDLSTYFC